MMRRLSLSLIAAAVLALITLGWLLDSIYQHYWVQATIPTPPESQRLFTALAVTLNNADSPQQWLMHWPRDSEFKLSVVSSQDIALPVELQSKLEQGEVLQLETDDGRNAMTYLPAHNSLLVMDSPKRATQSGIQWIRVGFTSVFYVLLVAVLMLWLIPLLRRIQELEQGAKRFGEGELTTRVAPKKSSYIYSLEQTFNAMAQQIETLLADVKLLSSAVSHDLRTPLAKIRLGLEVMADEQSKEQRQIYEQRLQQHVDDMVALIEALMGYARMDQVLLSIPKQPVEIIALVTRVCDELNPRCELHCVLPESEVYTLGDSKYLQRAFSNILENAVKYGDGLVQISVAELSAQIHISIEDNGVGVDKDELVDIFKPFTRGQKNADRDGFGLGLAFVKRVVEWHAGRIQVTKSQQLGGAKFSISLPVVSK